MRRTYVVSLFDLRALLITYAQEEPPSFPLVDVPDEEVSPLLIPTVMRTDAASTAG